MDLVVKGKNLEVTESLKDYAQKKLARVGSLSEGVIDAAVTLSVIKNKSVQKNQIVEVTIHLGGGVIRAEEATENMYASLDLVTDKIERQLKKFKKRHNHFTRTKTSLSEVVAVEAAPPIVIVTEEEFNEESETAQLVREKQVFIRAMTPEEATNQMDMLGHGFFVFLNQGSNQVNVVYHRKDGHYGLIEPVLE